jgi:hypothetical protein
VDSFFYEGVNRPPKRQQPAPSSCQSGCCLGTALRPNPHRVAVQLMRRHSGHPFDFRDLKVHVKPRLIGADHVVSSADRLSFHPCLPRRRYLPSAPCHSTRSLRTLSLIEIIRGLDLRDQIGCGVNLEIKLHIDFEVHHTAFCTNKRFPLLRIRSPKPRNQ